MALLRDFPYNNVIVCVGTIMAPELGGSGGCIMYCKLGSMSYVCIFTPTMFSFFRLRGTN